MDVYGGGQSGDISDGDDSEIVVMSPAVMSSAPIVSARISSPDITSTILGTGRYQPVETAGEQN